jgi:SAM-dependent methyltransferase
VVLQVVASTEHAASEGYGSLAPYYDAFTHHPDYPLWIGDLAALARAHGASGGRLLDVACGTGKSLAALLDDSVISAVGVDAVPEMVEMARRRHGDRVELVVADMTRLPRLGTFDMAFCINDALNCLLTAEAVGAALRGIAANLRAGGVLVFDVNTPLAFRQYFAVDETTEADGMRFEWRGRFDGARAVAELDVFDPAQDEPVVRSVHIQQHHEADVIDRAVREAGLEVAGRYGYDYDGKRQPAIDETTFKAVYVVKRTVHPPS